MKLPKHLPPGFVAFMALITLWLLPITLAPFMLISGVDLANPIYAAYGSSLVCHQLNSRSLCYFPANSTVADCTEDSTHFELVKTNDVAREGNIGYKFPVCARDIGIYYAMLLGGIMIFLLGRQGSHMVPNPWFLAIALLPMAIDGGAQLIGLHESSNFLRIATGFIGGIALPFYFVPMLNGVLSKYLPRAKQ